MRIRGNSCTPPDYPDVCERNHEAVAIEPPSVRGRQSRRSRARRWLPSSAVTITVRSYKPGAAGEVVHDPEDISELLGKDGRLLWVDLADASDEDFALVQDEF